MKILRCHRLIITYFGNYRNFVAWSAAIVIAVIAIDSFLSPRIKRHPRTLQSRSEEEDVEDRLSTRTIAAVINNDQKEEEEQEHEEQEEKEAQDEGREEEEEEEGEEGEEKEEAEVLNPLPPRKEIVHTKHCGLSSECPNGQFSYYARSGYGKDGLATICFNENYIVAEDKVLSSRGLNMVVINDVTLAVEDIRVFDVYSSDASLLSYLQNDIKGNHIIMVASQDEASFNLSGRARREFYEYGSSILDRVEFRDNYVIIGQRGLQEGGAIEGIEPRKPRMQFAESAVVSGCMTIPVGKLRVEMQKEKIRNERPSMAFAPPAPPLAPPASAATPAPPSIPAAENQPPLKAEKLPSTPKEKPEVPEEKRTKKSVDREKDDAAQQDKKAAKEKEKAVEEEEEEEKEEEEAVERKKSRALELGEEELNCGVKASCSESSIAVRLFTGRQAKELPKICVNGRYVLSKGLNGAGRGLNFVVFDQNTKEVTDVVRFDTYGSGVNALKLFLRALKEQEIVMAVAHDESSSGLNDTVRAMIESLGSSFIKRLSFRDVWAFIGQKGLNGFSPYEEFEYSDADADRQIFNWPKPIDLRICVPLKMKALSMRKVQLRNDVRRNFCRHRDGYAEFCSKDNIDKALTAKPLHDNSLSKDPIFTVPVIVIAGLDYNSLRIQLEGLLSNPGIRTEMIAVLYDEQFEEAGELATVFNMTSRKLETSVKYTELMKKAIEASWTFFPNARFAIFLEEEVFPSSDFLNFFRQCLPSVEADDTLAGISAWNDNAYEGRAGAGTLAYRVEMFPGLGFLLKKSFYERQMQKRMADCCTRRSWEGWNRDGMDDFEMVIPDISRVRRDQYNGRMTDLLKELFRRPRATTAQGRQLELSNADALEAEKYEGHLKEMISKSGSLNQTELQRCLNKDNSLYPIDTITKGSFSVFYEQKTSTDEDLLYSLCRCFNLFHSPKHRARGTHRGLVRFNRGDHSVFLIGSKTKYFDWKPKTVEALQFPKERT